MATTAIQFKLLPDQLGVHAKAPCRVATSANVSLVAGTSPLVVDGVTLVANDRVLLFGQTTATQNGIYRVLTPGTGSDGEWEIASDFRSPLLDGIAAGLNTYVQEGTSAQTIFYLVTTGSIALGVTALTFLQGAPLVRSDASGTDVLGSSGSPQVLSAADTYFDQSGFTDTRDFGDCVWHVTCGNKGTATKLTVKVEWSEDGANLSSQGSESISSGVSTLSEYIAEYDISGELAPFNLPAILLPVAAPNAQVSVKADLGTTTEVYVRAWRKA